MPEASSEPKRAPGEGAPLPARGMLRVVIFAALVLAIEVAYGLLAPRYSYPDELSHQQAVGSIAAEGRLPDPYDTREKIQQDKHPPYYYVLSAWALAATRGSFDDAASLRVPGPWDVSWDLSREQVVSVRDADRSMRDGQLLVLRGISALHWLLAALALLALADLVFPRTPRFAWALALGFATIPQAAWSGAAASPDTPLVAFCAWAFYFLLRVAAAASSSPGRAATRDALLAGLFCALALLAKAAAVCLVPVALLVLTLGLRRHRFSVSVRHALCIAVPSLLLAAWWYVYNFAVYGDVFQMHALVETYTHAVRREALTWVSFEAMLWDIFRTFFGFEVREHLLPRPLYFVFAGLLGVACCGLALLMRRALRNEVSAFQSLCVLLSLPTIAVMLALTIIGNMTIPSAQGRYLYPTLPALMVCAGVGWRVATRARGDAVWAPPLAVLWAFAGLWLFGECLVSRTAVQRSRAEAPGVVFYEDSGSPGLHPHEVQGFDTPDRGMLGRVLPERSVSGHPEAVVYRFPAAELRRARDAVREGSAALSAALQLRVRYFNPDSSTPYVAEQAGRFVYATQRLRAGKTLLHDAIEVTGQAKEFIFPLEDALFDERPEAELFELRFEKVSGLGACVAELWIEESWLLAVRVRERLSVQNRGPSALRAELQWRGAGAETSRIERFDIPSRAAHETDLAAAELENARVQLLALERSPWALREAESWIDSKKGRWFGQIDASGAYFVSVPTRRPRGPVEHDAAVVARLPFGEIPPGAKILVREHRAQMRGRWTFRELDPVTSPEVSQGVYGYRVPARSPACVDYAMLVGGWRR